MVLKTLVIAVILVATFAATARTRADKIKELMDAVEAQEQEEYEKKGQMAAQNMETIAEKSVVEDDTEKAVEGGATRAHGDAPADSAGVPVTSSESPAVLGREGLAPGGQEISSNTRIADSKAKVLAPAAELPPEAEDFAVWLAPLFRQVFPSHIGAAEAGKRVSEAMAKTNSILTDDKAGALKAICDKLGLDPEVTLKCKETVEGKLSSTAAEEAPTPTQVTPQKEQAASSAKSASSAAGSTEIERRAARNSRYDTQVGILQHYGDSSGAENPDEAKAEKQDQGSKVASFANAVRAVLWSPEVERRAARNGQKYTQVEFLEHYGDLWGAKKWDEAKEEKENRDSKVVSFANAARAALSSLETERRAAVNGRYFTKAEFLHHYGDSWGAHKWDEAKEETENQYPKVATFNNAAKAVFQSLSARVRFLLGYY